MSSSLITYTTFNVTPYTEYTVLMYSVITSVNGEEIRSNATPQQCTTYKEGNVLMTVSFVNFEKLFLPLDVKF